MTGTWCTHSMPLVSKDQRSGLTNQGVVMHRMLQFLSAGRRFDVHGVGLVQYHNLVLAGRQRDLHFTVRRRRQRAEVQDCTGGA